MTPFLHIFLSTTSFLKDWSVYSANKPLLFNSGLFLVLFLVFYAVYIQLLNKRQLRIIYVVAFSLFFYYKSSGYYFWILLFSAVVDYYLSFQLDKEQNPFKRKILLIISLVSNLGLLFYFKYTNFFIENINAIANANYSLYTIILPVGISFYTFQTLSYTIDVYRKDLKPTKSFMDFLFFVSFFPQLVAGPIVRAKDFLPQIAKKVKLSNKDFNYAFFFNHWGVIKKSSYFRLHFRKFCR